MARQLGEAVAGLHALPAPAAVKQRDVVSRLRGGAPTRLAQFGLPPHLVEQVPDFLADAPEPHTLVHADITADHLFLSDEEIEGNID